MCETYARTIIALTYAHYKRKVLGERPGQIERFRVARFFDPPFVKNASISSTGVDEIVAAFKLCEHRDSRNDPAG